CNFTNMYSAPENFICENPSFHKSALARFTPDDFIRLVRERRIAFHEKKLGQLFCDGSSRQIIDLLLDQCKRLNVEMQLNCTVSSIHKDSRFTLSTSYGEIECESLVIASGGLSIPKIGATSFGYDVARQFGIRVTELRPGLVPLTLAGDEGRALSEISGVSLDARVRCERTEFRENILLTHRGLSGPAILQISSYWHPGDSITIDANPEPNGPALPKRFLQKFREVYGERPNLLREWLVKPSGTEGYAKAEVTVGGIDATELSSKTMESTRVPG